MKESEIRPKKLFKEYLELSKKDSESFWHKGISDRSFTKNFQLHKHIIVDNAELKNGLLKVSYHRDIPEAEKPKTIKIKSK